jgi:multiple sugar transport system ATP-binding protein
MPVNRFVAGFIGSPSMNFIDVTVEGTGDSARLVGAAGWSLPTPPRLRSIAGDIAGKKLVAGFRPEHLDVGDGSSEHGNFQARADVVEYLGNEELLHVSAADQDVVAIVNSAHRVRPGDIVPLRLPLDKLYLFDAETGASLASSAPGAPTTVSTAAATAAPAASAQDAPTAVS